MKHRSMCQRCQCRTVLYEPADDLIVTEACQCGAPEFSYPRCQCEGCAVKH